MKRHDPREAMTVFRTLSDIMLSNSSDREAMRHVLD